MVSATLIYQKLEELVNYYENYLNKNNEAFVDIIIDDDSISFYLLDKIHEDNFIISFNEKDFNTFMFLSIKIIVKIFGNVLMHLDGVTLYNNVHRKNIKISVLNEKVYKLVKKIIDVQEKEFINDDLELIKELNKKASLKYPEDFMEILSERVNISKKILIS